jgi:hypothetical protein
MQEVSEGMCPSVLEENEDAFEAIWCIFIALFPKKII